MTCEKWNLGVKIILVVEFIAILTEVKSVTNSKPDKKNGKQFREFSVT